MLLIDIYQITIGNIIYHFESFIVSQVFHCTVIFKSLGMSQVDLHFCSIIISLLYFHRIHSCWSIRQDWGWHSAQLCRPIIGRRSSRRDIVSTDRHVLHFSNMMYQAHILLSNEKLLLWLPKIFSQSVGLSVLKTHWKKTLKLQLMQTQKIVSAVPQHYW